MDKQRPDAARFVAGSKRHNISIRLNDPSATQIIQSSEIVCLGYAIRVRERVLSNG